MNKNINFYKDKVSLNVLAKDLQNALECYDICEGNAIIGILSSNYDSVDEAVEDIKLYQEKIDGAVSVGLGGGDPKQSQMVANISGIIQPQHANQVFTGVGSTRALSGDATFINALISPTGKPGFVNIATGPLSKLEKEAIVPIETAIALIKDMGGNSVKFFPMRGLDTVEEYKMLAKACAANNFALEPTGGITLDNFEEIITIALDAGVKKIIPHVYSSIVDKETKLTKPEDVKKLYAMIQRCVDQ